MMRGPFKYLVSSKFDVKYSTELFTILRENDFSILK